MQIAKFIQKFIRDEEGVTAIEYGLLAALIAVAIMTTVTAMGSTLKSMFGLVNTTLANAQTAAVAASGG